MLVKKIDMSKHAAIPCYLDRPGRGYAIMVRGRLVVDLFQGKSGWWMVSDKGFVMYPTLQAIENKITLTCERINK